MSWPTTIVLQHLQKAVKDIFREYVGLRVSVLYLRNVFEKIQIGTEVQSFFEAISSLFHASDRDIQQGSDLFGGEIESNEGTQSKIVWSQRWMPGG